jgi:hypothetical protein
MIEDGNEFGWRGRFIDRDWTNNNFPLEKSLLDDGIYIILVTDLG